MHDLSDVTVAIPFRDQGDRTPQLEWLRARYEALLPEVELIVEPDDGEDPFSKTIAVNNCLKKATRPIIAVIDADVWVEREAIETAAKLIRNGDTAWVRPADRVLRLTGHTTRKLIQTNPAAPTPTFSEEDCEAITGTVGLAFIVSAEAFRDIAGMDPRFRGWGWEDNAFNWAMRCLHGQEILFNATLIHLWHPRGKDQEGRRVWKGQQGRNAELGTRYKRAARRPTWMRRLIEEHRHISGIKR